MSTDATNRALVAADQPAEWWHCYRCGHLEKYSDPEIDGCSECGLHVEVLP